MLDFVQTAEEAARRGGHILRAWSSKFTVREKNIRIRYKIDNFKNPNLKWLDPANGIGNYTIRLIQKLLIGLKDVDGLENEEIRFKWIVENMIYVCEIQILNQFAFINLSFEDIDDSNSHSPFSFK